MNSGVYIAVFHLAQDRRIQVGKLGRFLFPAGTWLYVGSAQRGLEARLARHSRRKKTLRWHIDYLSAKAEMIGAITIPGKKQLECRVAAALARVCERPVPGFGASDCSCDGHLFYARGL
jgi:sugar fermentation stimulation protein A